MPYFTSEDVLEYLSNQGFKIKPSEGAHVLHYTLTAWNNLPTNRVPPLGIETGGQIREVTVRPVYSDFEEGQRYLWQPGIRQLFSKLEVTAGNDGSFIIDSQKPIFFGKSQVDGYFQIRLLRTKQD